MSILPAKGTRNYLPLLLTLVFIVSSHLVYAQADTTPTRDYNLAMGNPSNASFLPTDSNNYLIEKPQYALSYNNTKGIANWVAWHLSKAWKGSAARCNCFTQDSLIPTGYFRASTADYTGTGFNRGHLCPSDDRDASDTDNAVTFKMSNIAPQAPLLNQQTWGYLENYCRNLLYQVNEMYIFAGGIGSGGTGSLGGTTLSIAGGDIIVPEYYWKIIMVLPVDSNDLARVDTNTRVITVLMPNSDTVNRHTWDYYRVSVDSIEALTGYDFFPNVGVAVQAVIEAKTDNEVVPLLAWDFTGANNVATWAATTMNSNLDASGGATDIIRGSGASASVGSNSFRSTGFRNDGIAVSNTDYYQVKMKVRPGYTLSLSGIDATYAGTSTFCAAPGVSGRFAYSFDGINYTFIGAPFIVSSSPVDMSTIDLSGVPVLQHISSAQTVSFRYYASGQTTTGGWGFYSSDTGNNGLSFVGSITPIGTIYGPLAICAGVNTTFSDATPAGVWSSSNTSVATIGPSTGVASGISAGVTTISYTVSGSTFTATLTVNPLAVPGPISGTAVVCAGSTAMLTDATGGGVWSSSASAIATVSSAGLVTGVAPGVSVITYAVSNICGAASVTHTITVNPLPGGTGITGPSFVCVAGSVLLSDAVLGGTWQSSATTVATVGATGLVTGVMPGIATISHIINSICGSAVATHTVTVNLLPATAGNITGASSVCATSSISLTDAVAGGTWSSSAPVIATVNASGMVFGVTAGTAIISYFVDNGCSTAVATRTVTVKPLPLAGTIYGASSVCPGNVTLFTNAATGGAWSSSDISVAVVSISGAVTGISAGPAIISYTVSTGCGVSVAVRNITVLTPSGCGGVQVTAVDPGNNDVTLFPNPATAELHIAGASVMRTIILGMDGKVLIDDKSKAINVNFLAEGVYTVKVYDGHNVLLNVSKFVKTNK